ncbi:hypothetical protein DUT91_24810 [Phyllobacterium salinisoli]|uniref:Uncharacterized protein n=2 Tax=Phyllobacterium salinisoli TaxID=1899321 RepID=A0A368JVY8_9HYPH|nr:hypothetical protein DUT91_24810 [Phyllobacterium salinisoli]
MTVNDIGYLPTGSSKGAAKWSSLSEKLPGNTWGVGYSTYNKRLYTCGWNPDVVHVFDVRRKGDAFGYSYLPDVKNLYGIEPQFPVCSSIGQAYVTCFSGALNVINTTTNVAKQEKRVPAFSFNNAFSPDGRMAYFPAGNVLYALNMDSPNPAVPIPLSPQLDGSAHWVTITRNGDYAYCGGDPYGRYPRSYMARVDLSTQREAGLVKDFFDFAITHDVSFDNKKIFVGLGDAQTASGDLSVAVIDISQNARVASIFIPGDAPCQIACSPVAPRACATVQFNDFTGAVQVIDTDKNTYIGSIPTTTWAGAVGFDEYGNAYAALEDKVMVILRTKLDAMGNST